MLRQIAERGNPRQRDKALRSISLASEIRTYREGLAPSIPAPAAAALKARSVYDAGNGSSLPGRLVRSEGAPACGDPAADEAYDGSGATFDLYYQVYGRNSIDGASLRLDSSVHYLKGYDNAFWNSKQMVYGDGDGDLPESDRLFNRFTIAIDVIGHELIHGVTQYEAALVYRDQPGALNESFSDVFGSLVKQRVRNQSATQADWIIGEGLFTSNVNGYGIRSMKAPGTAYDDPVIGKDPQPAHMRDYLKTGEDNGGVYINSGIPNHAFYLAATQIGGYAWEKTGLIWFVTLRDKLQARSDFQDAARLTYQVAGERFGTGSPEQQAVQAGWEGVGLSVTATRRPGKK